MGLLMLDVDRFKRVNDRLGHAAGDRVLRELARRLQEAVRDEDTVARWGGDEFVVVLPELAAPEAAGEVRERIRTAVRPPIEVDGDPVHVDLTAGAVVNYTGKHRRVVQTGDPEELIRFASLALHWAKEEAPGGFSLFDPTEEVEGATRIRREGELRGALERGEIVPHYQPIVRLGDGARVGLEALARWEHPQRGLLPPSEFVPMAEDLGLIAALQEVVVRRGCRDVAARERRNGNGRPLSIGFNLSGQQFRDRNLAEGLEAVVNEAGCRPGQVFLEVTETSVMQTPATIDPTRAASTRSLAARSRATPLSLE
jgi:diguanylate cyclase (GGDEF)-like protein